MVKKRTTLVKEQTTLVKEPRRTQGKLTTFQAFRKALLVVLTLAALSSACAPAQPAQSPQEVQAQIETSVAMTVAAQNAQAAAAQPAASQTSTPTLIPFAIPTLTPIIPSATGFVVVPPSSGGGGGGGGGGSDPAAKPPQYACAVIAQSPEDGTQIKSGDPFDVKWTIKNIGTKTWTPPYSFAFFSGTNMSPNPPAVITVEVKPGKTLTLSLDANAPINHKRDPVLYIMQWAIKIEGSRFCRPFVAIYAIKPPGDP